MELSKWPYLLVFFSAKRVGTWQLCWYCMSLGWLFLVFSGKDNVCVSDINECEDDPGICQYNCTNTVGGYQCFCPPGYRASKDTNKCEGKYWKSLCCVWKWDNIYSMDLVHMVKLLRNFIRRNCYRRSYENVTSFSTICLIISCFWNNLLIQTFVE